jgi:hypothetical protein
MPELQVRTEKKQLTAGLYLFITIPTSEGSAMSKWNKELRKARIEHIGKKIYYRREVARRKARYPHIKERLIKDLGGKVCSICGDDSLSIDCYDFDHKDPETKQFNIGQKLAQQYGYIRLRMEVNKCRIVCHNCHVLKNKYGYDRAHILGLFIQARRLQIELD